ncbi:hypothetical protein CR513_61531, partial [Mucuna pruriens]
MEHFIIPCHKSDDTCHVANLFSREVVRLHGLPKAIVLDKDLKSPNHFWRTLWNKLGTKLLFSTACHPQADGQIEIMKTWEDSLPHIEFAYNKVVNFIISHTSFKLINGFNPLMPLDVLHLPNVNFMLNYDGVSQAQFVKELHAKDSILEDTKEEVEAGSAQACRGPMIRRGLIKLKRKCIRRMALLKHLEDSYPSPKPSIYTVWEMIHKGFCITRLDDLLDELYGVCVFSKIDL